MSPRWRISALALVAAVAMAPVAYAQQPLPGSIGPSGIGGGSSASSLKTCSASPPPTPCVTNQTCYCALCKSVADGVTASSQATGGGNGATLICNGYDNWYVYP